MHKLIVEMGPQSYPIYIGSSILSEQYILPHIRHNEVMIVTNATVAKLYHAALASLLKTKHCESVLLPDGEAYKDLDHLNLIFDALLKHKFSRHCTLIALGGGVIGDMAGFAAACYQRGV
ncbi:MAG: aroB, partial [Gammaproteobacteria bacterium]|nr:aroB [Gammaproteobacteria bacterium]